MRDEYLKNYKSVFLNVPDKNMPDKNADVKLGKIS